MKLTIDSRWRKTLCWLRREHPLGKRVRVRQMSTKDQGYCEYINHRFEITIQKKQCLNLRMDTLLHEWAHALTWWGNDVDSHDSEWGLAYARLYRTWITWNYGQCPGDKETQ
jgi:hypothetical protein